MRASLVLVLMLLAACGAKVEVTAEPVVVMEEPALEASAAPDATRCVPGEDDGIGGTGCQVD
jgi:uncharacterized protein YcfL